MAGHAATITNPEDCKNLCKNAEGGVKSTESKRKRRPVGDRTKLAYWKAALRRCSVTDNFTVQIAFAGQRGSFTFGNNAEVAAEKARQIFMCISDPRQGWAVARARYARKAATRRENGAKRHAVAGRIESPTVGEVIRVCSELSTVREATLHGYVKALRFIASEVFKVPHTVELPAKGEKRKRAGTTKTKDIRKDYRRGGVEQWREKVDSISFARLTPAEVQRWKKEYLAARGSDPVAIDRGRVSFNRALRNAKSLFAKNLMPFIESKVVLPRPLFFEGVDMEKTPPMRYRSTIDPTSILEAAVSTLAVEDPETFKAFFLCLALGLRRREVDTLLWSQVDFVKGEVSLHPTEHYQLKSRDSARMIALDDTALGMLRGWRARATGAFILESRLAARPLARTPSYRCTRTFKRLMAWLREQGVTARKPIHELRKECGTLLLRQGQSIEAVSRYLGHSTLQVTMAHYADIVKQRATFNLSALMPVESSLFAPISSPIQTSRTELPCQLK